MTEEKSKVDKPSEAPKPTSNLKPETAASLKPPVPQLKNIAAKFQGKTKETISRGNQV